MTLCKPWICTVVGTQRFKIVKNVVFWVGATTAIHITPYRGIVSTGSLVLKRTMQDCRPQKTSLPAQGHQHASAVIKEKEQNIVQ